jgi:hypothetical protein
LQNEKHGDDGENCDCKSISKRGNSFERKTILERLPDSRVSVGEDFVLKIVHELVAYCDFREGCQTFFILQNAGVQKLAGRAILHMFLELLSTIKVDVFFDIT